MFKLPQILRYIIAGSTATLANLETIYICVNYFHLWYLISAAIAFCVGVITSYVLQRFFTFEENPKTNTQKQFSHFFIFALVMLGLNTLLVYVFVDIINIWYLLSQALASLIIAFLNYIYFSKVIFNKS
ncbi:MAG: GtrA family protein [Burkholderiales bacterium]|nr:GtrA family protein [Burkholderiales bacterium]